MGFRDGSLRWVTKMDPDGIFVAGLAQYRDEACIFLICEIYCQGRWKCFVMYHVTLRREVSPREEAGALVVGVNL
jgi:hypothetical protein